MANEVELVEYMQYNDDPMDIDYVVDDMDIDYVYDDMDIDSVEDEEDIDSVYDDMDDDEAHPKFKDVVKGRYRGGRGKEEVMTCTVCLEDLIFDVEVSKLPCSHIFHGSCVDPWLEKKRSCPNCRNKLQGWNKNNYDDLITRVRRYANATVGRSGGYQSMPIPIVFPGGYQNMPIVFPG
ncbi:hypothetical protein AgCh_011434 [Apium graveolens]